MIIESSSITSSGQLLTACAANKSPNNPKGENLSPHVSWAPVEGAACYAVVMFDEDANWLHWYIAATTETELEQGMFTNTSEYIGPYPPKSAGAHTYRIEVFALKQVSDTYKVKMNGTNTYSEIVTGLDTANGQTGNVIARDHLVCSYANGDKTP